MCLRVALALVVCLVSTTWAEEWGSPITGEAQTAFLTAWSARLRAMQALHMVFTQEKSLRVLRQPLTAQGELWLKDDTLLYTLTNTAGVTELVVHLDKQSVRTYYPLLNTLEVIATQTAGPLPQSLPFWSPEPAALQRDYEVELFLDSTGQHTLRLVPRDSKVPLQEMRLVLRDFQPQEVIQVEKNGTRVRLHITSFTINPAVSESQVELHIPAGTRVVQPLK